MLHTFLFHLGLKQHFQRHNSLQFLHPCEVDIAKLALPKGPTNVKVFNGDFPDVNKPNTFNIMETIKR